MKKTNQPESLVLHGYVYRNGEPVRFPAPRKHTKSNPILPAENISDFRIGIDRVVRYQGFCYIVPGDGPMSYEPMQVASDILTGEGRANLERLSPEQLECMLIAVVHSAILSDEGKRERIEFINSLPRFIVISPKS